MTIRTTGTAAGTETAAQTAVARTKRTPRAAMARAIPAAALVMTGKHAPARATTPDRAATAQPAQATTQAAAMTQRTPGTATGAPAHRSPARGAARAQSARPRHP